MLTGTLINAFAVLLGSMVGLLIKWFTTHCSHLLPKGSTILGERLQAIIMQGLALSILSIGLSGCLKGRNTLIAILSMVIGAVIGELLNLTQRMETLGDWVQNKTARLFPTNSGTSSISDGFVTTTLLFCVGAMAIVGSLENGLTGTYDTLKAKSVLDGISSIVFASSMGIGVALTAVSVFLYQGSISLLASFLSPVLSEAVIAEMTCVGSLMILALSFNLLHITNIKVMNLIPAIFLPILLCQFM